MRYWKSLYSTEEEASWTGEVYCYITNKNVPHSIHVKHRAHYSNSDNGGEVCDQVVWQFKREEEWWKSNHLLGDFNCLFNVRFVFSLPGRIECPTFLYRMKKIAYHVIL